MNQVKNMSGNGQGSGGSAASRGPNTENRKSFSQAKMDGVDKVGTHSRCHTLQILIVRATFNLSRAATELGSQRGGLQQHCHDYAGQGRRHNRIPVMPGDEEEVE
eukprot:SAG25_NODE_1168_length_3709_cov_2.159280_4_plen_105_part_00